MRIRGKTFWAWADPTLHHRTYDEFLEDGALIDVQVRLSRTGSTQLFLGIYSSSGMALHEESFDSRPGESMTRALSWGVVRARHLVSSTASTLPLRAGLLGHA